jgi:hypothetical protein
VVTSQYTCVTFSVFFSESLALSVACFYLELLAMSASESYC